MKWKYLDEYVKSYKENEGVSEIAGFLPKLVVYFREALDKLGFTDCDVPDIFCWDEETAEDFLTWGHNSRWNHTFSCYLDDNLEEYVQILKDLMDKNELKDFELTNYHK